MARFQPVVDYEEGSTEDKKLAAIKWIANRVHNNNKNFLCCITGQTGSGKSYTSGSIAEIYSRVTGVTYNPEHHVVFSFTEFIKLINSGELGGKLEVGSVITFDEPQVSINNRSWQSQINKAFNSLVSTFRNLRLVVFFATPYMEFLDLQTRTLFHANFEISGIDKYNKVTILRPYFLEYNPTESKFYRKFLDVRYKPDDKSRKVTKNLNEWKVPLPSKEWIEVYERKKKEFTTTLNKKLEKDITKEEGVEEGHIERKARARAQLFQDLAKVYDEVGEDYLEISRRFPQLGPETLYKAVVLVKKSKETTRLAGV